MKEVAGYLAAIVESSDDAIIGKTLEGIITSWNPSATRIFGYQPEEAIGKHISLIIPPEREDEEFIIIGKVKSGQRVDHFETVRRHKDGRLIDISVTVSPIRNADGDIIGASKIARDITQARIAERVSAHLGAIISSSDDAIVSKNLDGIVTSWNPAAERIFGWTEAEMVGNSITTIIPKDRLDEEYVILKKIQNGERIEHFETIRRRKDGGLIEISATISPIRDRTGTVIGASKIARNIAEQKRIENELRESNRRKDDFLANISHELRTPMNAVIGLTQLLGMSDTLNERERKYVDTLQQSADGLLALINSLLDFAKMESDEIELDDSDFSLRQIVSRVTAQMEVAARKKGLRLDVQYAPGFGDNFTGDALRMQQVLTNLLANAVKFTEKGGVTLKLRQKPPGLVELSVVDTGIGIPADKLDSIFEKFSQVDVSMSRQQGGSGLGLSICRAIVHAMGGTISVLSRPGLGSTFTVEVPLEQAGLSLAATEPRERPRKNVLIVEDYEPNVLVATAFLDRLGYDYDIARNGLEALREFERCLYDVVLMDVQMPGMDGFESTRLIRDFEAREGLTPVPIVAMTAHVREKDKQLCLDAGMDDFIPKPFQPQVVTDTLARYITKQPRLLGTN
ncbi:MAG TPA: PAS domain S-box protein [Patescibacteria group bacterium]|nr:PAS domain S-box protein [Patescibacteria group bacterium]